MSSIIEKGLKSAGLSMTADALPAGSRTVKAFQRLIAAMRSAESEVNDQLNLAQQKLNEQLELNLRLQERVRMLEGEESQHRLREGLAKVAVLTVETRTELLDLAKPSAVESVRQFAGATR